MAAHGEFYKIQFKVVLNSTNSSQDPEVFDVVMAYKEIESNDI